MVVKSIAVTSTTPISLHFSFDYQFMSDSNTTIVGSTNFSKENNAEIIDGQ